LGHRVAVAVAVAAPHQVTPGSAVQQVGQSSHRGVAFATVPVSGNGGASGFTYASVVASNVANGPAKLVPHKIAGNAMQHSTTNFPVATSATVNIAKTGFSKWSQMSSVQRSQLDSLLDADD
jgi:hypothetical protein